MVSFDKSLYLVTDSTLSLERPLDYVVEEAVKGGVTIVQLREKEASTLEFYQLAVKLKECLTAHNVPLIINDRIDIALACDADGLHIGQSDMPYPVARRLMGRNKIIGLSVENEEQALLANDLEVDYIGASPVFSTLTKTDTASELGLNGLATIKQISRHPVVAIGGINLSNAGEITNAGADAIAVVSAIMSAENPQQAAKELIETIKK